MSKWMLIFMVFCSISLNAQTWQWARAGGGVDDYPLTPGPWESYLDDMTTDRWGNVYLVGDAFDFLQFTGTTDTFHYYGGQDAVMAKYDKCGNFQWAITSGSPGYGGGEISQVLVDSSGNIYVGAYYLSDHQTPTYVHKTAHSDTAIYDRIGAFYMKYDPNGNLIWMNFIGPLNSGDHWFPLNGNLKQLSDGRLVSILGAAAGTAYQNITIGNNYSEVIITLDPNTGAYLTGKVIDTLDEGIGGGQRLVYHPFTVDANDNVYLPIDAYNFTGSGNSFATEFLGQPYTIPPYAALLLKIDKNLNLVKIGYDDNGDAILNVSYSEGAVYSAGWEYAYSNYLGDTVGALTSITAGGTSNIYRVYKLDTGTLAPVWASSPQFENSTPYEIYITTTSKHVWMSGSNLGETIWDGDTIHLAGAGIQQYLFKINKATGHCDTIYVDSGAISTAGNLSSMIIADEQENIFIGGQFTSQFATGPNTLNTWGGQQSPIFYVEKFGITCADSINTNDNPYPPTNLITTAGGISSINLQWTDNSPYRISFHIYRSPNGINNWQLVDTVLGNQITLVDTGLASNTWYWYKVAAWNIMGESDYTNIDSAKTLGPIGAVSISGLQSLCFNTVTGVNYTTSTVTGATYAWSINGGTITQGNNTNSILVTWNNTGPHHLKLTECVGVSCSSDSISITVKPVATTTITQTICQGQVFDGFTGTGTYVDTFVAANGCDSMRTLHLTVIPLSHSTLSQSICPGQSYLGYTQTGTFIDTLHGSNGCDSIRTLTLTVLSNSHSTIAKNICPGQSFLGHNQTGTYVDTLTGANNCDSIRTLNLTLLTDPTTTITQSICLGQSYGGHNATGTYIDTFNAANTCDSIRTLHLTVTNGMRTSYTQSICAGHSFDGFTQTGTYVDTFSAVGGCDSIRTLNLTVLNNVTSSITQNICQGQAYGGHTTTGTFIDTLQAANSCDSIRTLHLTVLPVSHTTLARTICPGQSYAGHTATGTYIDTLNASNGCDSIRTLTLTVLPVVTSSVSRAICQGQAYGGHTSTGTYVDTFTSANGCDSVRTLGLTVSTSIATNISRNICQGQSSEGYDTTGTYIDSFTAVGGCDSVRTLHLTVTNNIVTSVTNNICQGQAYDGHTQSGTYVDTFASAAGCDSIRTLHLTVNPLLSDTFSHVICQGDTFNGHTLSGFYTDSLIATTSCDSFVTLHLIVNPLPVTPTVSQQGDTLISSVAYSYQWFRGSILLTADTGRIVVINQNGSYTVVTADSAGCSNTSAAWPVTNVGIQNLNAKNSISIYPNPTKDQLTYDIYTSQAAEMIIEIDDVTGNLVIRTKLNLMQGYNSGNLKISELAAGYYEIGFISNGLRTTKPIVKF